jgi:hypothetical protein
MDQQSQQSQSSGQEVWISSGFVPAIKEVYPAELSARYPHVLEKLEVLWDQPEKVRAYFQELLMTERETRKGFPLEVYMEIFAMSEHYNKLHPFPQNPDDDFWTWAKLN